jgi:formamidopyrimidine-DNA glycosylase
LIDFFKKVGPEPLSADFTPAIFKERIARRARTSIKAAILDQTTLAGVGNIYADESLWMAKIHPQMLVGTVSSQKLNALYNAIREVLQLAIDKGGSSDRNYVDAEGRRGSYLKFANVFRREGQPCNRCGTTIIKTRVAGRGTHICPNCQKPIS